MTLNNEVWVKIAPSPIHGVGVFAIRDIPQGQKMYCQSTHRVLRSEKINDLLPEIKELIIQRWTGVLKEEMYLSPNDDARLVSFMNHSDTPNYNHVTDLAMRDIKKGEEIVEHYGFEYKKLLDIK